MYYLPKLLLHWRRNARSSNHIQSLLPCFIFWHIWKAQNAYRFNDLTLNVNAVVFRILHDIYMSGLAFGYKSYQLKRDQNVDFMNSLHDIPKKSRPIQIGCWTRPMEGCLKLNMDGCSKGNPRLSTTKVLYVITIEWYYWHLQNFLAINRFFLLN